MVCIGEGWALRLDAALASVMQGEGALRPSRVAQPSFVMNCAGAKLECGGGRIGDKGYLVEPTVFSNATDEMAIARDEVMRGAHLHMERNLCVQCVWRSRLAGQWRAEAGALATVVLQGIGRENCSSRFAPCAAADLWPGASPAEVEGPGRGEMRMEFLLPCLAMCRTALACCSTCRPCSTSQTHHQAQPLTWLLRPASLPRLAQVIQRCNATEYGLAASVWTSSIDTMQALTRGIKAGTVWVPALRLWGADFYGRGVLRVAGAAGVALGGMGAFNSVPREHSAPAIASRAPLLCTSSGSGVR